MIEIKSPEATRESALLLLILMDAFLAVTDKCFGSFELVCSTMDTSTAALREDRPAMRMLRDFEPILTLDAVRIFNQTSHGAV